MSYKQIDPPRLTIAPEKAVTSDNPNQRLPPATSLAPKQVKLYTQPVSLSMAASSTHYQMITSGATLPTTAHFCTQPPSLTVQAAHMPPSVNTSSASPLINHYPSGQTQPSLNPIEAGPLFRSHQQAPYHHPQQTQHFVYQQPTDLVLPAISYASPREAVLVNERHLPSISQEHVTYAPNYPFAKVVPVTKPPASITSRPVSVPPYYSHVGPAVPVQYSQSYYQPVPAQLPHTSQDVALVYHPRQQHQSPSQNRPVIESADYAYHQTYMPHQMQPQYAVRPVQNIPVSTLPVPVSYPQQHYHMPIPAEQPAEFSSLQQASDYASRLPIPYYSDTNRRATPVHTAARAVGGPASSAPRTGAVDAMALMPLRLTFWDDEKTHVVTQDIGPVSVSRRLDNDMVNGTKMLNLVGMSRGKRDAILKMERSRKVVRSGAVYLKGVWILLSRAQKLAHTYHVEPQLAALFGYVQRPRPAEATDKPTQQGTSFIEQIDNLKPIKTANDLKDSKDPIESEKLVQ